uniref:Retrovirus-related Pol polyprotein from transposon TNT 1-94 n=1 Tax=Tanacetum cinerariifolium TaxID=118510 RepID=A0A6L2NHE0_TANCI|nr:retrovirus-related Pol polyprotein from transposon TNT 1-94 [Tanacetum cinerariifolium]
MLCYLARVEPYNIKCIKDGLFQPKTAEGDAKPESQYTPDEMKETRTDLVHSFEGPSNIKENMIIDLKLEYQTFRAKFTKSLLQTYTRYKALLNEITNDGVNLSKHEINNKGLVPETFDWNKKEVFDEEEVTHVKVLIALADNELAVRKKHARNGKWVDITMRKDKEEKIKKAVEEAKLLAMSKTEVIKVVREEAKKLEINPKEVFSTKTSEKFKKAHDAELEVFKKEHSKKVKRITKLNKRRAKEYMWTMINKIKPEPITDIKIHPNIKPLVKLSKRTIRVVLVDQRTME